MAADGPPTGLPILWRASLRHLLRRPSQLLLAVAGVALGIAVILAVDLASRSAERAFRLATSAVTGSATDQIVGGPTGLPDSLLARIVLATGAAAAPVVEDYLVVPPPSAKGAQAVATGTSAAAAPSASSVAGSPGGRLLHLLGIDPFSESAVRSYLGAAPAMPPSSEEGTRAGSAPAAGIGSVGGGPTSPPTGGDSSEAAGLAPLAAGLGQLLVRPDACLLAAPTAAELGLRPGDSFQVRAGGRPRRLTLAGVLRPQGAAARQATADLLVMDVAAAQELLGRVGSLDRIDLRLPAGGAAEEAAARRLRARIDALLPPGAQRLPAAELAGSAFAMTRAFRVNLTALSLLALLCGAFLIFNTMTFSVVQRRPLLGTLRTLGVTRAQVLALVLGEAAAVGLLGTAGGFAGGVLLGRGLLRLVTQTINDLYFVLTVRQLALPAVSFVRAGAIGLGATLAAALAPALEAALTPPRGVLDRSRLESTLRRALPRTLWGGAALLALGAVLLAAPAGDALVAGFAGMGAVVVGCALLAPAATVGLMRLLRPALGRLLGVRGRMAAGGVVAALSRTAVAIAALMVAVSVAVGIGVMIASFRQTVVRWLASTLQADIYVTGGSVRQGAGLPGAGLPPELAARAAALPGVTAVHTVRRVELPTPGGPVRLVALDNSRRYWDDLDLLEGDHRDVWRRVVEGSDALVSESFARRHRLGAGSALDLPTARGPHRFAIVGVYADFASDLGVVTISRATYLRWWRDPRLSGFSLDLAPPPPAPAGQAAEERRIDATIRLLRRRLGTEQPLAIQSNASLRRLSLAIFDRTFRITNVLRLLAGLVAAMGVLSALTALQLERSREIAVLRATGMTPGEIWQLVTAQTGLMGLAAGLLSLPVGLLLSAILVYVIDRRSFGWTVRLEIAPAVLVEALLLALAAAVAAGLYPAWRMARTPPAAALRDE